MHVTLLNPNTNRDTTSDMVAIAREACPEFRVTGLTAPFGASLITTEAELAESARAVEALAPQISDSAAVIVAAFGDPALEKLRNMVACPVIGIAEAAMSEAATGGRRFAVVTTTPDLSRRIAERASDYGHARFAGTWVTPGDPVVVMSNPDNLIRALGTTCLRAVAEGRAEAIIIGGGPLARAARALTRTIDVPLIEPVPEAMRRARQQIMAGQT